MRCSVQKVARSQDEILARIKALSAHATEVLSVEDFGGWRREVLIEALDYTNARPFIKPDVTEDAWFAETCSDVNDELVDYFAHTLGNLELHKPVSSLRAIARLREYVWLGGHDGALAAMDAAPYGNFGAPKLRALQAAMAWEMYWEPTARRMAEGKLCRPTCDLGCEQ